MHIVIDAVGIRGHGGAAVLTELLHWLPVVRPQWRWHVFLLDRSLREFDDPQVSVNIKIEHTFLGDSGIERLWWVNKILPGRFRCLGADILFSFANIAPSISSLPQVVFCHQPNAFFPESVKIRSFLKKMRFWFMRWQILRGALSSRAVLVQTRAMSNRISRVQPLLKQSIRVIPSGYRTQRGKPDIRENKKKLIYQTLKPRLIYISHPGESKNHLIMVEAMPKILESLKTANLMFTLEKHHPSDLNYKFLVDKIIARAEALGVADKITWLGILNPDEVDYSLKKSDLMVFPSQAESFGLGLVESMAAGCPVVASDLSYAHDVCGEAALYFNPYDPESLAETVTKVFSDCSLIEELKLSGEKRKNLYSYRSIAEDVAHVLEV